MHFAIRGGMVFENKNDLALEEPIHALYWERQMPISIYKTKLAKKARFIINAGNAKKKV